MGTTHLTGLMVAGVPTLGSGLMPMGVTFFVDSVSGNNTNKGTFDQPFATLAYALTQCTASQGDVIVLNAGHAETISSAAGIAVNVAGVSIIGLGNRGNRPTFTFASSTAATMTITANNVRIANIVGTTTIDQIVSPFVISGSGVIFGDKINGAVEWQDGSSSIEAVNVVLTTAAADNLSINLKVIGFIAGSNMARAVNLVGADNAIIDIDFYGKASTAIVNFTGTSCKNVTVSGYFYNSGTTNGSKNVVDTIGSSTWGVRAFDGAAGVIVEGGSAVALAATTGVNERVAKKSAAVLTNGMTLFTVAGGPIEIQALVLVCETGNDATASTLQFSVTPTSGSAQTISAASASVANATAGASVALAGTALTTAALYNANGPNLIANPGTIFCPAGTITLVVAVGSTTGTWAAYIRYKPLAVGVTVS